MSERADLKPCPLCGDSMEINGDLIRHINQGTCMIGVHAWEASARNVTAWNTRAPTAERIAALEEENAALKAIQADDGEMLTIAWMDGAHRAKQTYRERIAALESEAARLREREAELHGQLMRMIDRWEDQRAALKGTDHD